MARGGARSRHAGTLVASALTILFAILLAAAAHAQLDPARDPGPATGVDTSYTPTAKPPPDGMFRQVSGPTFREDKPPSRDRTVHDSPVPFEADLLSVSFASKEKGFAGGSICREPAADPDTCARLPVIYSYDPVADWRPALTGTGPEGFVSEIAWIDSERALAVGGSGVYREREKEGTGHCAGATPPTDRDNGGEGRVWLFESGSWRELRNLPDGSAGDELPDAMSSLSAVDFYVPRPGEPNGEFGIIGGLCQIWHWSNGGFLKAASGPGFSQPFSYASTGKVRNTAGDSLQIPELRYRVRTVGFAKLTADLFSFMRRPRAFAGTGSCCAGGADQATATPTRLIYSFTGDEGQQPDTNESSIEFKKTATFQTNNPNPATYGNWAAIPTSPPPTPANPDTYLDMTVTGVNRSGLRYFLGTISTETGPAQATPDPPPEVDRWLHGTDHAYLDLATRSNTPEVRRPIGLTSARLIDGDGDLGGGLGIPFAREIPVTYFRDVIPQTPTGESSTTDDPYQNVRAGGETPGGPDGIPDWIVGELDASTQGIVYATDPSRFPPPENAVADPPTLRGSQCTAPISWPPDPVVLQGYADCNVERYSQLGADLTERYPPGAATGADRINAARSSYRLLGLPSYALSSIDVSADGSDGWMVGPHGTVVRMNVSQSATKPAGEPDPPQLDTEAETRLPDRAPWAAGGTEPSGPPGAVPTLIDRPRETRPVEELELEGHPEDGMATAMIMKPDGSSGWAIDTGFKTTLSGQETQPFLAYHFNGERWSRCTPLGRFDEGRAADPDCRGVAELAKADFRPVAVTRVPTERDTDPSNDGLEIVAISRNADVPVARYTERDGWKEESPEVTAAIRAEKDAKTRLLDVAFTSPDHGWAVAEAWPQVNSSRSGPQSFFKWEAGKWKDCLVIVPGSSYVRDDTCDPQNRLPQDGTVGATTELHAAGDRVYAVGFRAAGFERDGSTLAAIPGGSNASARTVRRDPMIIYRSESERESGWAASPRQSEYDPGDSPAPSPARPFSADIKGLSIVQRPDGAYEGWAAVGLTPTLPKAPPLLRLKPGGSWEAFYDKGATRKLYQGALGDFANDYHSTDSNSMAISPTAGAGPSAAMIGQHLGYVLSFNRTRERWQLVRSDRPPEGGLFPDPEGRVMAATPDGAGGFWVLGLSNSGQSARRLYFYRATRRPRRQVFEEASGPSATPRRVTALAAEHDGTLWATTASEVIYRHDRLLGWDDMRIPGWEPGKLVTHPASANAIDFQEDGSGLVVGDGGRIARIGRDSIRLDNATGVACRPVDPQPPCGTPYDLLAVSIAPDRSALAVGRNRTVLWRPARGGFRSATPPPIAKTDAIVAVAMPTPTSAWVIAAGALYRGTLAGGAWRWDFETPGLRVNAIAVRSDGSGYAVGSGAKVTVAERRSDGTWVPVRTEVPDEATAVGLYGEEEALVGTQNGGILTRRPGGFEVSRMPNLPPGDPQHGVSVRAMAVFPGPRGGDAEAWAALTMNGAVDTDQLLRFTPDDGEAAPRPLPDAPPPRRGEFSFAALGKMGCLVGSVKSPCFQRAGVTEYADLTTTRIVDEIAAASRRPGGPRMAVSTGDAVDTGGYPGEEPVTATSNVPRATDVQRGPTEPQLQAHGPAKMRSWGELIADRLAAQGVPIVGAIGGDDLSDSTPCMGRGCLPLGEIIRAGDNLVWRQSMSERSFPWGSGPAVRSDLTFRRLRSPLAVRVEDRRVEVSRDEAGPPSPNATVGGADTHYAVDLRDRDGELSVRLVVADNSMRSLSASDPQQQPQEGEGGQAAWLERMLCIKRDGDPAAANCTRKPDQRAMVVANTPTYSYGPGASTDTATDGAAFEAILMRHQVDVVVSGRIGWNGRYWATAPGLHEPCPGSEYPEAPPARGSALCGQGPSDIPVAGSLVPEGGVQGIADALRNQAPAPPGAPQTPGAGSGLAELLPFVVASGGGGRLAQQFGEGNASRGFWHGYTIVRVDRSGDPRKLVVEQRPVYDWIGIEAQDRVLRAGQKMTLRGYGRGPIGRDSLKRNVPPVARLDRIDSPAITHRYDLLAGDPRRPWLPKRDAAGGYELLDPSVATIDRDTGLIRAGRGNHPRAFAVGLLSVGELTASYPLIFEPRRTFVPKAEPTTPRTPSVIVQSAAAGVTPPASPGAPPQVGSISPPALPSFPSLQPPPATPPIGQPAPAPPPPPPLAPPSPAPLGLAGAPPGLTVAPPAAVIPPPAPPINPAPPGGARKEARQRQAATEKSGSDAGAGEEQKLGGDMADGPPGPGPASQMTALDRTKAEPSFTTLARPTQPSAWSRGALYGGGLLLASLALAGAWGGARPRPRGRPPTAPAPAFSRPRQRR